MTYVRLAVVTLILLGFGGPAMATGRALRDCTDCPLMRVIPAGSFLMGSSSREPGRQPSEGPRHNVRIEHPFAIGAYDVTRKQFARFVQQTNYETNDTKCDWRAPKAQGKPINQSDNDPVVCVSWRDAEAYASWLSRKTGHGYRLRRKRNGNMPRARVRRQRIPGAT